jgi:hypothetical protein
MINPGYSRELIEAREADVDRWVREAVLAREARLERSPRRIAGWLAARAVGRRRLPEPAPQPWRRAVPRGTTGEAARGASCCGRDTTAA